MAVDIFNKMNLVFKHKYTPQLKAIVQHKKGLPFNKVANPDVNRQAE
jgi:hypothetical protein